MSLVNVLDGSDPELEPPETAICLRAGMLDHGILVDKRPDGIDVILVGVSRAGAAAMLRQAADELMRGPHAD